MAFEQELRDFMQEMTERSVRLETKLDTLVGTPGQEGRVPKLEREMELLVASENKRRGAFWAFTTISGTVIGFLEFILHRK